MTEDRPTTPKSRSDGMGSVYEDHTRGVWVASVPLPPDEDGTRRRKKKTFRSRDEAERGIIALHREVAAAGGNVTTTDLTAAAWLAYWLDNVAARRLAPKTMRNYRSTVNNHLIPALGKTKLKALTAAAVRRVHDAVRNADGVNQESTVLLAHRVLSVALRDAKREGKLHMADLPTAMTDAPSLNASTREPLLVDQATAVLAAIDPEDPLAARWAAAVLLGARQGELLGLERDRVHDDHVDLTWQLQSLETLHGCGDPAPDGRFRCGMKRASACTAPMLRDAKPGLIYQHLEGALFLTKPKTKAGDRVLPLVEPMRSILHARIAASSGGTHGLVWHTNTGSPVRPKDDADQWHALLERAGVPSRALHTARGTTASVLMRAGVAETVRIALMGHATAANLRPYETAENSDLTDAATTIVRALFRPGEQPTSPEPPAPDEDEEGDGEPPRLRLVR